MKSKNHESTPLADALIRLKRFGNLKSFHALPISCGKSIANCKFANKYQELLGDTVLSSEMTLTGKNFDSFFFPEGVILEAEALAAEVFNADGTLFITTGTTTSNQIAIHALCKNGGRVLLDRQCHQSMHFTLHALRAEVEYVVPSTRCEASGRNHWDVVSLLDKALAAQEAGRPYNLIILNAQSYDGVIYDVPGIISYLLANGVVTRNFLIDEAWGAANYFNPRVSRLSAMNLPDAVFETYGGLCVVATQSAHKSLSCMRQSSMIHFRGPERLRERLQSARFQIHTTSPSYPILGSLDLARAQMSAFGEKLTQRSTELAAMFIDAVSNDPALSAFSINQYSFPETPFPYVFPDPTKISLNVEGLGPTALQVKEQLYARHGIYINRITGNSLLLNFHIGISHEAVVELLDALREMQASHPPYLPLQLHAQEFVIPYPPGVPLIVPGESVTNHLQKKIREIQNSGIRVFSI